MNFMKDNESHFNSLLFPLIKIVSLSSLLNKLFFEQSLLMNPSFFSALLKIKLCPLMTFIPKETLSQYCLFIPKQALFIFVVEL